MEYFDPNKYVGGSKKSSTNTGKKSSTKLFDPMQYVDKSFIEEQQKQKQIESAIATATNKTSPEFNNELMSSLKPKYDFTQTPDKNKQVANPKPEDPSFLDRFNVVKRVKDAYSPERQAEIQKEMNKMSSQTPSEFLSSPEYKQKAKDAGAISSGVYSGSLAPINAARGIINTASGIISGNKDLIKEPAAYKTFKDARQEVMANRSFAENIPEQLSRSITEMIPSIALGGTPGLAYAGVQSGSQNAQKALDEGATAGQAAIFGAGTGIAEALTERLGLIPGISSAIVKGLGKSASKNLGKIAADYGKKMLQEGLEEVIMEPVTGALQKATYQPDKKMGGQGGVFDISAMAQSGILGALAGGLMGGAQIPSYMGQSQNAVSSMSEGNLGKIINIASQMPTQSKSFQVAQKIAQSQNVTYDDYVSLVNEIKSDNNVGLNPAQASNLQDRNSIIQSQIDTINPVKLGKVEGKFTLKQTEYETAKNEYDAALLFIQDKYRTDDLVGVVSDIVHDYASPEQRIIEVTQEDALDYIKSADGIDMIKLASNLQNAELALNESLDKELARLKSAPGMAKSNIVNKISQRNQLTGMLENKTPQNAIESNVNVEGNFTPQQQEDSLTSQSDASSFTSGAPVDNVPQNTITFTLGEQKQIIDAGRKAYTTALQQKSNKDFTRKQIEEQANIKKAETQNNERNKITQSKQEAQNGTRTIQEPTLGREYNVIIKADQQQESANNQEFDKEKSTQPESDIKQTNEVKLKSKAKKTEELPNTIPELEQEIKNMEEDIKNSKTFSGLNLQLFSEAKRKLARLKSISKFYTNTLEKINDYTDEQRNEFEGVDGEYTIKSEAESLKEAEERLSRDFDAEVESIRKNGIKNGVDTDVAMGILEIYRNDGEVSGDYSKMKEWAKVIRSKGATEMGRGIQAFAKYSRTPEHFINEAERIIDDVEDDVKNKNSEIINTIDNETKILDKVINESDKKAGEETVKEIEKEESKPMDKEDTKDDPAVILAKKIKSAVNGPKVKEKDVVMKMVNELFQKFKETDTDGKLPQKLKADKINDFLEIIKNKDVTDKVWQKAKEIVRSNFKDDLQAMEILDNYFGKGTRPPFSDRTAITAIKEAMKKLNYKLSDIVKDYYAVGAQQRTNVLEYMKTEARLQNLTTDEINVLSNYVDAKFKDWKKEYAGNYLKNLYKEKNKNAVSIEESSLRFIDAAVNAGILLNQNYSNKVNEKIDPKLRNLIRASGIKLHEIVKLGKNKVDFERDVFVEDIKSKLKISENDAIKIGVIAKNVFTEEANKARKQLLNGMLRVKNAKKRQRVFDKVIELINLDAYSISAIRDVIKQKEGLPILDNDDISKIIDAVNMRNEVEQDSYLYRLMTDKIETIMANKVPATLSDKTKALQRISLLLNPKTNVRNIAGNIILTSTENLKDLIGAPIDLIIGKIRGTERTTLFNPVEKIKWQYQGSKIGLKETTLDAKNSFDKQFTKDMSWSEIYKNLLTFQTANSSAIGERYNLKKGRVFDNKTLNFLDNSVKTVLSFGDRPFFEAAYNMRLNELMKIKKLEKKNEDVDMLAKLYALDRVFQNDSELSKRLTKIRDSMGIAGTVIFPFVQTPANVYDKLLDYTPAGFAKALWELGKLSNNRSVRKVIQGEFDQKVFVDRMARSFTGTGLMLIGGILAALGMASGGEDNNEKVRQHERATKQAYSIKIGDKWFSYEQLQPIGGVLAMGIDAYNKSKDKAGFLASIGAGFDAAGNTFVRSSFMRNAIDIIGAVSGSNGSVNTALTKIFKNATSQTNPTFVRQISDLSDEYVRETYDPNPLKQFVNQYIAKIPMLSRTLPSKVDVYGNDIKRFDDANNVLNVMFNPLFLKGAKMTPVQKEITDIFAKTNNKSVLPSSEDDVIKYTRKGTTHTLTLSAQQYINYQKLSSKILTDMAESVISSDRYKNLSGNAKEYEIKAKLFSDIVNQAHDTSRKYIIKELIKK